MTSVSVIIPVKNRLSLLEITLNNILSQALNPTELFVVDDHSEEDIKGLVSSKFAQEVIYLKSRGEGPGAARNTGLREATGKYIKFFDSDDLMTSNTLIEQTKVLEQTGKGFVYSPYFYAYQDNNSWIQEEPVILNYYPFDSKLTLPQRMCRGLFITIPGMLFKRNLLTEVGSWREDIVAYEDFDYLFRIGLVEPLPAHTNQCAFLYRLHGNQTVGSNFSNHYRDEAKFMMLKSIRQNFVKRNNFEKRDNLELDNIILQTLKMYSPDHDFYREYGAGFKLLNHLFFLYKKLESKVGRIRTDTSWQPHHGLLKSKYKFKEYLGLIN